MTHICMPLYPLPAYPIMTATLCFGLRSSAAISSSENGLGKTDSLRSGTLSFLRPSLSASFHSRLSASCRLVRWSVWGSRVDRWEPTGTLYGPDPVPYLSHRHAFDCRGGWCCFAIFASWICQTMDFVFRLALQQTSTRGTNVSVRMQIKCKTVCASDGWTRGK